MSQRAEQRPEPEAEAGEWVDWDDLTPAQQQAILDAPCDMRYQPPMDFAWCETHDTTFPLGAACRYSRPAAETPRGAPGPTPHT